MGDLDKLIAAVEAGKYDRPSGVRRYYDFGEDSIGIVPGSRMADEALSAYADESQFRRIEGYPRYLAGADGRIVSFTAGKPKVMAHRPHRGGYVLVTLCDGCGGQTTQTVHRVIASAFHPNPDGLPCVRHLDGDKKNNCASNLAWGSYADNEADKIATGTRRYGTAKMKLRRADREEIATAFAAGESRAQLAARFKVDRSTISRLIAGATWANRKWPMAEEAARR